MTRVRNSRNERQHSNLVNSQTNKTGAASSGNWHHSVQPRCRCREQAHGRRTKGGAPTSGGRPVAPAREQPSLCYWASGFHRRAARSADVEPLAAAGVPPTRTRALLRQTTHQHGKPHLLRRGGRSVMAKRPPDPPRGRSEPLHRS